MKKILASIFILVLILAGCSLDNEIRTAELNVGVADVPAVFGLESISMITDHYLVTVTNETHGISYPAERVSADNPSLKMVIASGNTSIKVDAYNKTGDVIGSGTSKLQVKVNDTNSVSVTVKEFPGTGTLDVDLQTTVTNLSLEAKVYRGGIAESNLVNTVVLANNSITPVSLDNGFYFIVVRDKNGVLSIPPKTARIVKDHPVNYTISVDSDYNINIEIEDNIVRSPEIVLSAEKTELEVGETLEVSSVVSGLTNPTYEWWLDGQLQTSHKGSAFSMSITDELRIGVHRLALFAKDSKAIASEEIKFTVAAPAVPEPEPEVPLKGITLDTASITLENSLSAVKTFTVTRNTEDSTYGFAGVPSWIVKEGPSTSGLRDTWTLRISANEASVERKAEIKVGDKTLTVIQPGKAKGTSISVSSLSFPSDGGSKEFTVTKNTSDSGYTVTNAPSWAEVAKKGSNGLVDTWTVKASPNGTPSARTVTLGVGNDTLTIRQDGKADVPAVPGGIENVTPGSIIFAESTASSMTVTVTKITPETEYDAVPAADWIKARKASSGDRTETWTVSVSENPSASDRKSSISFGSFTVPVAQGGKYTGPAAPESIVIDSITPDFDDVHFWLDTTYSIHAHVSPLSASQELEYRIESRGTGHGSGSQNRFVDSRTLPAFIEFDGMSGTVRPYELGDNYWSRDYRVTVSSKADPSVSSYVDFTIAKDDRAGIRSISKQDFALQNHEKTAMSVEVQKYTAGSTQISWSGDPWLAASRKAVSPNGLTETWEIVVGPNRTRSDRTGQITFSANNTRFSVSVSQPGNPDPQRHTEWVYGVVPPEESEYVRDPNVSPEYFEIYERKDIDQGWYLATKSQLSGQDRYNQDQNMCWAYSATNLIHWWAENNAPYVEAFKALHPELGIEIAYDKNAPYVKDKSTVMPWFLERHGNTGGHPNVGLLDMLVRPRNTGKGEHNGSEWGDLPNRTYPGWFNEVFRGHDNEIVQVTGVPTKEEFHTLIEKALLTDKGIGLNIHYYNVRIEGGYHAVNIWGITYDENGEIVEVVIGDNNLNSARIDEPNLAYLTNYRVTYDVGRTINDKTESEVEFWNTGVTENSENNAMGCINQLVFLDLGTELWEDWAVQNGVTI